MACEVVVIPTVMVICIYLAIHRVDHRQVMRLLRQQRQVFTQFDTWRRRLNRLERTAIFKRCFRFHVPAIEVRCAATQKQQDCRSRF